jgi:hypothetical protein
MHSYADFMKAFVPYQRPEHKPPKRPLRTYSRAAAPDRDEERPRKKRVVAAAVPEEDKENIPSSPRLPELPPQKATPAMKGSILVFFKPVSTSSSASQSQIVSDLTAKSEETVPSSPPSPPPIPNLPEKRKRRLGTRAVVRPSSPVRGSRDGSKDLEEEEKTASQEANEDNSTAPSSQPRRPSRRQPPKATVQTTLALTDDPAFTICKDCEMLYNPLNEKDKRHHTRRHAAALRKRRGQETPAAEE